MNKYKKILNVVLCLFLIFSLFSVSVSAKGIAPVHNDNSVKLFDYADLLKKSEEKQIENKIKLLEKEYGYDIVVVLTNDVPYEEYEAYADDFFDYNNYGPDGVLFLYDFYNRIVYMSTAGKCIRTYSDSYIERITSEATSFLQYEEYEESINCLLDRTLELEKFSLLVLLPSGEYLLILVVISAIVGFALVNSHNSINKKAENSIYISKNENAFNLTSYDDKLIDTKIRIEKKSNNSDSSSHRGSSGRSHGGGGSRF